MDPSVSTTVERLRSVDVGRGFAILGMLAANTAAAVERAFPSGEAPPTLLHARWEGVHFADLVFPLFLWFMGISIALAMDRSSSCSVPWPKLVRRSLVLITLGLGVNSVSLLGSPSGTPLAVDGTLQRIGVVYFLSVLLFLRTSCGVRIAVCTATLVGYAAVLEWVPFPGVGPPDLLVRNLNVAAWVDLVILGELRMVPGADGIPTRSAGALLSLPATAVISVLGTVVGECIRRHREAPSYLLPRMLGAAGVLVVAGLACGLAHPMIKQLWSASFVLYVSGVSLLATAVLYATIDVRRWSGPPLHALEIMGRNSITAYLVHVLAVIVATVALRGLYAELADFLAPEVATIVIVGVVSALVFAPVWVMNRHGRFLRL